MKDLANVSATITGAVCMIIAMYYFHYRNNTSKATYFVCLAILMGQIK